MTRAKTRAAAVCLILAPEVDPHVRAVVAHLDEFLGVEVLQLDTEHALRNINLNLELDSESGQWTGTLNRVAVADLRSIWYRRPRLPRSLPGEVHQDFEQLAEQEMRATLQNLYRIAGCRLLPHPGANREADHKLLQLAVAAQIGFKTPRTVLFKDGNISASLAAIAEPLAIKCISSYQWSDDQSGYALRTARITKRELSQYHSDFSLCPTLIQEYIPKRYEWRITVIETTVYACRIDSQQIPEAREDWRQVDFSLLPHRILPLQTSFEAALLGYMKQFDLNFGAFDFIETPQGDFVFLECNPNGQWLWIELATGAPISASIADFLFSTREGGRANAVPRIL